MSEEKKSFMQELDVWTGQTIMEPLLKAARSKDVQKWNEMRDLVYREIRKKVLESYRNGQAASGAPKAQGGQR